MKCDTIGLYKDTMLEDAMKFGDSCFHAPTQQEPKIATRAAAYNAGDMDKVTRIDQREEESHKQNGYHRSVRKKRAGVYKASSSKGKNSFEAYFV